MELRHLQQLAYNGMGDDSDLPELHDLVREGGNPRKHVIPTEALARAIVCAVEEGGNGSYRDAATQFEYVLHELAKLQTVLDGAVASLLEAAAKEGVERRIVLVARGLDAPQRYSPGPIPHYAEGWSDVRLRDWARRWLGTEEGGCWSVAIEYVQKETQS